MNQTDYDKDKFDADAYGNLIPKQQPDEQQPSKFYNDGTEAKAKEFLKNSGCCGFGADAPEQHGFASGTPAECEDEDCNACEISDDIKKKIGCPYLKD